MFGVIREIDIWGVAVLMLKRYADDAEANADPPPSLKQRAITLARQIWRRVTVAIEQLTDLTGTLH